MDDTLSQKIMDIIGDISPRISTVELEDFAAEAAALEEEIERLRELETIISDATHADTGDLDSIRGLFDTVEANHQWFELTVERMVEVLEEAGVPVPEKLPPVSENQVRSEVARLRGALERGD